MPLGTRSRASEGTPSLRKKGSFRRVRPEEGGSKSLVKKPHVVEVGVAGFVSPRMVRHLRFGRQTRDATAGYAPNRRERVSHVCERLAISTQQMTVALGIEPNAVNVHLASSFVSQDEVLRGVPRNLYEPAGRQSFPQPRLMGVPHDEIQVPVFSGLFAKQGIDAPATVQPYVRSRCVEPSKDLDDIHLCDRHRASGRSAALSIPTNTAREPCPPRSRIRSVTSGNAPERRSGRRESNPHHQLGRLELYH